MDFTDSMAQYEDILKCSICLEILKDEKMLPCSHMYCLECLEGYVQHKRDISCPECRKVHQIPIGGVKNFPKNVKLRQFLDQLCPGCSKNPKSEKCPHCREEVCSKCKEQHVISLRDEITGKIAKIEAIDESIVVKDVKREKKILKDKENLMEKEISKSAEDLIKIIRNRERKLKEEMKKAFKVDNDYLDTQMKKHQDLVNNLKSFGRKRDVPKMAVSKLLEMNNKWPELEANIPLAQEGLTVKPCNIQHEFLPSEIGITAKRNWNILADDIESDDSSSISEPSPNIMRAFRQSFRKKRVSVPSEPTFSTIGSKGSSMGRLDSPFGVAIPPGTNNIVVADTQNDRLQTFDMQGNFVSYFGSSGRAAKQFNHPIGVLVTSEGQHIIADTKNHRIQILDAQFKFVRQFGTEGFGNEQFNQPWGVALDSNKILHISDCVNNRIQVVTLDGRYLRTIGQNELCNPTGIVIDKDGDIYVADCENHRIQIFSKTGKLKSTIGSEGQKAGELSYPDGLTLDKNGNVVVVEWGNHRVQVFSKVGKSLRIIGKHGSSKGEFHEPRGVSIAPDGKIIVCDCGNNRIQVIT